MTIKLNAAILLPEIFIIISILLRFEIIFASQPKVNPVETIHITRTIGIKSLHKYRSNSSTQHSIKILIDNPALSTSNNN